MDVRCQPPPHRALFRVVHAELISDAVAILFNHTAERGAATTRTSTGAQTLTIDHGSKCLSRRRSCTGYITSARFLRSPYPPSASCCPLSWQRSLWRPRRAGVSQREGARLSGAVPLDYLGLSRACSDPSSSDVDTFRTATDYRQR